MQIQYSDTHLPKVVPSSVTSNHTFFAVFQSRWLLRGNSTTKCYIHKWVVQAKGRSFAGERFNRRSFLPECDVSIYIGRPFPEQMITDWCKREHVVRRWVARDNTMPKTFLWFHRTHADFDDDQSLSLCFTKSWLKVAGVGG